MKAYLNKIFFNDAIVIVIVGLFHNFMDTYFVYIIKILISDDG